MYSACFSSNSPNILSPKTSEKPMIALSGYAAHATCWRETPTYAGWRPRSDGSCPRFPGTAARSGLLRPIGSQRFSVADDFRGETARSFSPHRQCPDDPIFAQKRNRQTGAETQAVSTMGRILIRLNSCFLNMFGTWTGSRIVAARPTTPSPGRVVGPQCVNDFCFHMVGCA